MHVPATLPLAGLLQGRLPLPEFSSQAYLAMQVFGAKPMVIPTVRAGSGVTITRDALGYVVTAAGGGVTFVEQEAVTAAAYPLAAGSPLNALASTPVTNSVHLFWRGTRCRKVASAPGLNEYTISGAVITAGFIIQATDHLYADYRA